MMQALSSGSDEESAGAELRRAAAAYAATSKRCLSRKRGSTAQAPRTLQSHQCCLSHRRGPHEALLLGILRLD